MDNFCYVISDSNECVIIDPGFDGQYGTVKIFSPEEKKANKQGSLFQIDKLASYVKLFSIFKLKFFENKKRKEVTNDLH